MTDAGFTWENIRSREIPKVKSAPAQEKIKKAFQLENDKDRSSQYLKIHDEIVELASHLVEEQALSHYAQVDFEKVLARTLHLLSIKTKYTMDPELSVDTFGSKCLHHHNIDFQGAKTPTKKLKAKLLEVGKLKLEHVEEVESLNRYFIQDAILRRDIIKAICTTYELKDHEHQDSKVKRLFEDIYGSCPIPATQIKVIITSNLIFFALPFDEKTYQSEFAEYQSLTQEEQDEVDQFLKR